MTRFIARLIATVLVLPLLVLVPAASVSAGGGCHGDDGSVHTEGTPVVVRMDVCSFAPTVTHVSRGTTVRFLNTSTVAHLVTGERQEWGSPTELQPGDEISHTFTADGVWPYSCPLHPGMVGAVVVGGPAAAGGAASTDEAGSGVSAGQEGDPTTVAFPLLTASVIVAFGALLVVRRRTGAQGTSVAQS